MMTPPDLSPDVETFRPLFDRNPYDAARELVSAFCKRHLIRELVTDVMPQGYAAYAIPRDRVITLHGQRL
jgi:hypothetical protein